MRVLLNYYYFLCRIVEVGGGMGEKSLDNEHFFLLLLIH